MAKKAQLKSQPRVPAGTRQGGQFAIHAGNETGLRGRHQFSNPYALEPVHADNYDWDADDFNPDELDDMYGGTDSYFQDELDGDEPLYDASWYAPSEPTHRGSLLPKSPPPLSARERAIRDQCVVRVPTGPQGSGDGYIYTPDGKQFWGLYGAAGLLVRSPKPDGGYQYFLAKRSQALSGGAGTWSMPGGAIDENESPLAGAMREFHEETGFVPANASVVRVIEDRVVPDEWTYTTIVVEVSQPFNPPRLSPSNWETDAVDWVDEDSVRTMGARGELHPGMANRLQELLG